jgi:hypothetical protein
MLLVNKENYIAEKVASGSAARTKKLLFGEKPN